MHKRIRMLSAVSPAVLSLLFLAFNATQPTPVPAHSLHSQTDANQRLVQLAGSRREQALLTADESRSFAGLAVVSQGDIQSALGGQSRRLGLFGTDSAVDPRGRVLGRVPYGAILAAAGERHHVDALLLAALVETESQFAARAVSPCGAVGLMQVLPATGERYGIKDLRDPSANVEAGSRYFQGLLARFNGRPDLALAAYNTGPEVVARYGCVPPYRETRDFVKRVLGRYADHRHELHREAVALGAMPGSEAPEPMSASR